MNKLKSILVYSGASLAILVSFIFAFLELRSLFAGDFTLMNSGVAAFFTFLFKGLYFLSIIALAIFIIIFRVKHKEMCLVLFASSIALFIGAFISFAHFEYFVSLLLMLVTSFLVAITALGFFKKTNN